MNETSAVFDLDAARSLPSGIRFGSSTWTYPGWKGLIYHQEYKSEKEFKATSLKEYCSCPLFRTVGIDSTFYAPPSPSLLRSYASMVPDGFQWVSKVWERISIPLYPEHKRYGPNAGRANPDFLNSDLFRSRVLASYNLPETKPHTGPFVFQFPTIPAALLSQLEFVPRLEKFLSSLPQDFRYAVEIRNPALLDKPYFKALNNCGATHCFNHWHIMPPLHVQMKKAAEAGGLKADFLVCRVLTPLGVSYENAVSMFSPYDSLKRPDAQMRKDVVTFARRAVERASEAFIIVNNRCEGNSPLTIDSITRMLTDRPLPTA